MPPKTKITKEEILSAALALVREGGIGALNARAVAKRLNCSTQPVFSCYASMEELKAAVMEAANGIYWRYLDEGMKTPGTPPYKSSGMAYIRFAKEERELFRLLFMRDRSGEKIDDGKEELDSIIRLIAKGTGLDYDTAYEFHLTMWVFVHGIATMVVTAYVDWDWDTISRMISDAYQGVLHRYLERNA